MRELVSFGDDRVEHGTQVMGDLEDGRTAVLARGCVDALARLILDGLICRVLR
jgi:hypothetical protein